MRSKDPAFIFDSRLVERHLKKGVIGEEEIQTYMRTLPDRSADAEAMSALPESAPQDRKRPISGAA
jgi:hypothetical protein